MKKGNKNLILFSIVFVLIIGIIYMWNMNMGKTSTQVKETISFLEELSEIGAINGEIVPVASDIQEVKTSSNGNATVGYTLKWHNCGVDLDKNYNVIGFLEQTTTESGETVLTEEQCIDYAEKYLKHILDNDFELKEVLECEKNEPFYTINFYRYHRKYINYDDIITVKINKYSGELVGFSALNTDNVEYQSFMRTRKSEAKKIAREYLEFIGLSGDLINEDMGYFTTEENISTLSYIFNYEITKGDNEGKICTIIISGNDGTVVKHSIKQ